MVVVQVKGRTEVVYPATEEPPTTTSGSVRYWIIAAVIAPVLLVIIIILLICWRWKAGAPRKKVEPEAGMKGADAMKMVSLSPNFAPPYAIYPRGANHTHVSCVLRFLVWISGSYRPRGTSAPFPGLLFVLCGFQIFILSL